jgi:hypothetical protein
MTEELRQEFYNRYRFNERHPERNEKIRREFWYYSEIVDRASRRKCVLSLARKYNLHPSRIYKIVHHQPVSKRQISRAELLEELLPGLNALFGLEYAEYGEESKEAGNKE